MYVCWFTPVVRGQGSSVKFNLYRHPVHGIFTNVQSESKGSQTQSKDLNKSGMLGERLKYVECLQFLLSFIMMGLWGVVCVFFIFSKLPYLEHWRDLGIRPYNETARFNSCTQGTWNPQQHTSLKCTPDIWPGEQLVIKGSHLNWTIHIAKNYVQYKDHK